MSEPKKLDVGALWSAILVGIDDGVFRRQEEWRRFPATFVGVDLCKLKIAIEKSVAIEVVKAYEHAIESDA